MTFKILSLDGGGIRGVLSATILKQIEQTLKAKKGLKLHEYFDLVTGTSTGSILAGGIVCQMDAQEMIDIYLEDGKNIFLEPIRRKREGTIGKIIEAFGSHLLYPHEKGEQGLAKILQTKLIHPQLGSPKISQITQPNILIPAYDVYSRNTTWFANNPQGSGGAWYDNIDLWKICTASASAPTFFPPYQLPYNKEQHLPHIDGGVSANNPSLMAIAHVLFIEQHKGINLQDIAVLSIGTGNTTRPYSEMEVKEWGMLGWAAHLPDMFLNPSAKNSEDICSQILRSVGAGSLRLNFDLNESFQGEAKPGQLRKFLDKPYNKYIAEVKNQQKQVSEEIDNPHNCPDLIEAAECYLECGKVFYNNTRNVPVKDAIEHFLESH